MTEGSSCSHFQSEFPLSVVEFLRAGQKICVAGLCDGLDSGWDVGGWRGWLQLCFSHSTVSAVPQSIKGRATPSSFLPRRTHICMTGKCMTLLLVKCSSLELTRQDNHSACLSNADGCLSCRKLCLRQGGKTEELLVAYRSFWDRALLSCLCLLLKWSTKTITLRAHSSIMTGVLGKQVWCNSE